MSGTVIVKWMNRKLGDGSVKDFQAAQAPVGWANGDRSAVQRFCSSKIRFSSLTWYLL